MTVALVGVGAHPSNAEPVAPLYEDGSFEFVPAPAPGGSGGTSEPRTFGNTKLRHGDRVMAEYLDRLTPMGSDGPEIEGIQIERWPLHYNPNFVSLTYGEAGDRGDYADVLRELEAGDAVAFYSVLAPEDGGGKGRYLIGHFGVESVVDFREIAGEDGAAFSELPEPRRRAVFDDLGENAYAKVYDATGELPDGDDLVIVEGTDPGTLLGEAVEIGEHGGGGHYYLTDEFEAAFAPRDSGEDKNAYLGGDLKAHVLDVGADEFRDVVG